MRKVGDLKSTIPYVIRKMCIQRAISLDEKVRGERGVDYADFQYATEAFNDTNIFRNPNKIGITLFYPDSENATHTVCKVLPFEIKPVPLSLIIKEMCRELESKIPEELLTPALKKARKKRKDKHV